MKKMISICLLLCVAAVIVISIDVKEPEKEDAGETEIGLTTESMSVVPTYQYRIEEEDGYLVVYTYEEKEIYFETNIKMDSLNDKIKEKIQNGLFFYTEEDLYDFLESYSS